MSSKILVHINNDSNTINEKWYRFVSNHIEMFKNFHKDEFEIVNDLSSISSDKKIVLIGCPTSYICSVADDLYEKGYNVEIIENLCCDTSVDKHLLSFDPLFEKGIRYKRSFKFVEDDLLQTIKTTLEESTRLPFKGNDESYFNGLGYDSLDLMNLVDVIEEKYNTYITTVHLTKFFKVKDFVNVLESGKISEQFNK